MLLTLSSENCSKQNGGSYDFTTSFSRIINVETDKNGNSSPKMSLQKIRLWNSWHNISAALGNNKIRYSDGSTYTVLTLPDGNYALEDVFQYIRDECYANGDYDNTNPSVPAYYLDFELNENTGKIKVIISNSYRLDLSFSGSPTVIFGGSTEITSTTILPNQADIFNGITDFHVHCSIASPTKYGSNDSDIIFSFTPAYPPNDLIEIELSQNLLNLSGRQIRDVRMYITDQDNRVVNFNDSPIMYVISLV